MVGRRFPLHPGDLAAFDWPVTPAEAQAALATLQADVPPMSPAAAEGVLKGEFGKKASEHGGVKGVDQVQI